MWLICRGFIDTTRRETAILDALLIDLASLDRILDHSVEQ
jgi:hypothetical protein